MSREAQLEEVIDIEAYCWRTGDVAQYLGESKKTVAEMRTRRRLGKRDWRAGPPFVRLGHHVVRYKPSEVADWFNNLRLDSVDGVIA